MKNTNFPKNNNTSAVVGINQVSSTPSQSPIIIPANVETPMVLRGPVESMLGSIFFLKYTNIEAGEFKVSTSMDIYGSIYYVLAPESAEGKIRVIVYLNDEIFQQGTYDIVHTDSSPDGGHIGFYLYTNDTTAVWKITAFTEDENIIFADVVDSSGNVKNPALTMELQEEI